MKKAKTKACKKGPPPLPYEWRRLQYFFDCYTAGDSKDMLWQMLKLSLTSNDETINELKRSNMIFFYEVLAEMLTHSQSLLQQALKTHTNNNR